MRAFKHERQGGPVNNTDIEDHVSMRRRGFFANMRQEILYIWETVGISSVTWETGRASAVHIKDWQSLSSKHRDTLVNRRGR